MKPHCFIAPAAFGAFVLSTLVFGHAAAGEEISPHPCAKGERSEGKLAVTQSGLSGAFELRATGTAEGTVYLLKGVQPPSREIGKNSIELHSGRSAEVHAYSGEADRYGRLPAHVFFTAPGRQPLWFQGQLIESGAAYARPYNEPAACQEALFAAERRARLEKRGLWSNQDAVLKAADTSISQKAGAFRVVAGAVASVGDRKTRLYLNFGKVWNEDFTVLVVKSDFRRSKGLLTKLKQAAGKRVRVRGFLESQGGALIRLTHAGQIEFETE